jgi:UrcA family protein
MFRFAPLAIAALAALSLGANAGGLNQVQTGRVIVPLNDLNLSRPADARIAFHRIERAAATACGGNPLARTWHGQPMAPLLRQYTLCQEEATARTIAELRVPTLAAAYVEKHHHTTDQWANEYRANGMMH